VWDKGKFFLRFGRFQKSFVATTRSDGIPQRFGPQPHETFNLSERSRLSCVRSRQGIFKVTTSAATPTDESNEHCTGNDYGLLENGPHCTVHLDHVGFDLITARRDFVFPLKIHPPRLRFFFPNFNLSTSAALANTTLAHFTCLQAPQNYYFTDLDDCRSAIMDRPPLPPNYMTPAGSKEQQYIKNDQPQFACTYEGCGKPFGRKEHLARHMRARMHPFARLS
jgi:hypothetical protein